MRALRWRAAITIVGAFLVMGYLWGSGRAGYVVQIDYSMTGDALDGAEVFIDGESVGALELYGRSGRAPGFKVGAGTHTVRVVHEHCPGGRAYDVTVGRAEGRLAIMMADIEEEYTCRVVLR